MNLPTGKFRQFNMQVCMVFFLILPAILTAQTNDSAGSGSQDVALNGYDPVAYFKQGEAVQGHANISASHNNVTYHFSNADDKAAFLSDPDKFAPQFGGFCAYGAAHGMKMRGDPQQWKIVGGNLYVFASEEFKDRWDNSTTSYIRSAIGWRAVRHADEIWARIKEHPGVELEPVTRSESN